MSAQQATCSPKSSGAFILSKWTTYHRKFGIHLVEISNAASIQGHLANKLRKEYLAGLEPTTFFEPPSTAVFSHLKGKKGMQPWQPKILDIR